MAEILALDSATLRFGSRAVWSGLDLGVAPGEFLAVLGPNGAGKSSLLRVLLGLARLASGSVQVLGSQPRRGDARVGYIAQQRPFGERVPLRGRDLVRFGLDGHRWGPAWPNRRAKELVEQAIAAVGAEGYADRPLGLLSGGEQQRLRIAQAIVASPALLLADEPLGSLDYKRQQEVVALLDGIRREAGTSVVFVTHEINPVLPVVDRVLYLAGGRWAQGTPEEVLTTKTLSTLYGSPVDVVQVRGRIVVVGGGEHGHCDDDADRWP
jgi:zinc/manganese transport system ATP-binding protein